MNAHVYQLEQVGQQALTCICAAVILSLGCFMNQYFVGARIVYRISWVRVLNMVKADRKHHDAQYRALHATEIRVKRRQARQAWTDAQKQKKLESNQVSMQSKRYELTREQKAADQQKARIECDSTRLVWIMDSASSFWCGCGRPRRD